MPLKMYPNPVIVRHRGGFSRVALVDDWFGPNKGAYRASLWLNLGPMAGKVCVSLGHGWAAKPCDDWRLADEDLEKLREWARKECGREICAVPRSPGRPRKPRRGKLPHPKQTSMF